jgi:ABC-type nickel/cobalt efflux system permease component RcnA
MLCRQCGTEIADKAIICFRCGAGTTDPVRKAAPVGRKRSPILSLVVLLLLLLLGLYLGQAAGPVEEAGPLAIAAAVLITLAAVLLIIRVLRRR